MEWVQTTGSSIAEAKDRALDELGVHEDEAEFEVLEEPRSGLFGRVRGEARVRARVKPTRPRAKQERRDRGRGRKRGKGQGGQKKPSGKADRSGDGRSEEGGRRGDRRDETAQPRSEQSKVADDEGRRSPAKPAKGEAEASGRSKGKSGRGRDDRSKKQSKKKESEMSEEVPIEEQGAMVAGFVEGLLDAFGADGEVVYEQVEDTTVEVRVDGEDLGLLIGPRGNTLAAVHELCRTVLQREVAGGSRARIRLDIGGYRQRRREALAEFARTQAAGVLEDQNQRALEPMGAADRKVIHDTVNEIDGVGTVSEGEDPRRRVVIVPEG